MRPLSNLRSKISPIDGWLPCKITFFARYPPRRTSAVPEPNCGRKIRIDGDAAFTCGSSAISSAHSGCNSLRVNHSLGGRESEAQGKRYAMMVSEPRSRIPPSTFSFKPLMSELTAITVVMPMTMPRIVSAERSGFLRSVSSASATWSFSSSAFAGFTKPRSFCVRGVLKVCATVDIFVSERNPFGSVHQFYSDRNASTGSSREALEAG